MKLLTVGFLSAFSITSFADANLGINEETEEMNEVITGPTRAQGFVDPAKRQAIYGGNIGNFGPTRAQGFVDPAKRQAIYGGNISNFGPTRAQGFVDPAKRQAIYGGIPANYEDSEE